MKSKNSYHCVSIWAYKRSFFVILQWKFLTEYHDYSCKDDMSHSAKEWKTNFHFAKTKVLSNSLEQKIQRFIL